MPIYLCQFHNGNCLKLVIENLFLTFQLFFDSESGSFCEFAFCDSENPCENDADCQMLDFGRYQCNCGELFSGINCTISQAGYSNGLLEMNNDFIFGLLTFSFSLLGSAIYIVPKRK